MMRRLAIAVATTALAACSLLVSTSGLDDGSGGAPDASEAASDAIAPLPPASDASDGATANDASDAGADADPTLLAAWSFDETSGGVAHDSTGHGHDATLVGNATFGAPGKYGGALAMDGISRIAVASLAGTTFPRSGTYSIWFRYESVSATDDIELLDGWDKTRSHLFVRHVSTDPSTLFQVALQPQSATGAYAYANEFDVPKSTWTHIVVTWQEAAQVSAVYVNGVKSGSGTYLADFAPTDESVHIGDALSGAIDEVTLWSRALGPAEIGALR
jgi:hypothetical protein